MRRIGRLATPCGCVADTNLRRSQFQISDGVGGQAQAEANAVGVDPFAGCDLSTVDATSLSNLKAMREVSPYGDQVSNAQD